MQRLPRNTSLILGLLLIGVTACGPDEQPKRFELPTTKRQSQDDADADGWPDTLERMAGMDPELADEPCASALYTQSVATVQPPVDFILLIDNSGSMLEELPLIAKDLSEVFYPTLKASGLDYRVLVMTRVTGTLPPTALCPDGELCQGSSFDPDKGALHLNVDIQSDNSLATFLAYDTQGDGSPSMPGGWKDWLRPGSDKIFIEMTDDESSMSQEDFEGELRARAHEYFYTARQQRRFVWHSVIGADLDRRAVAQPAEPIINKNCPSAPRPGAVYQRLSTLTRGLRFSICGAVPYREVFDQIVYQSGSQARVPCTIALPYATDSERVVDASKLGVVLDDEDAKNQVLIRRLSAATCAPEGGFYVEQIDQRSRIQLCPQTCQSIEGQDRVTARIAAACKAPVCMGPLTVGCP